MSKYVITTVGMSLFSNFNSQEVQEFISEQFSFTDENSINTQIDGIKEKSASEYSAYDNDDIKAIKTTIINFWIKRGICRDDNKILKPDNNNHFNKIASAEIASCIKYVEAHPNENITFHLIATDSALCVLAAEIIKESLNTYFNDKVKVQFNVQTDAINDLIVTNEDTFKSGIANLMKRIEEIKAVNTSNDIQFDFNITGGYKATVPTLTLYSQFTPNSELCYIFEDSNHLFSIPPNLPIKPNETIFENFWDTFIKLESSNIDRYNGNDVFYHACEGLVEIQLNNKIALNPIGKMLWKKYKSQFFIFYVTHEVKGLIKEKDELKKVISERFHNNDIRANIKTREHTYHKVFGDNGDTFRIFFIDLDNKCYIYKIFYNMNKMHNTYNVYLKENEHNVPDISSLDLESYKIKIST